MTPELNIAERRMRIAISDLADGETSVNEAFDEIDKYVDKVKRLNAYKLKLIENLANELELPDNYGRRYDLSGRSK